MMTGLDENLIRRFLLGELSPDEQERVGERLLADEEFFAQVDAVEEDLIDDYACGRLGAADSERFERSFLITDERRERLRFAREFHHVLSGSQQAAGGEAAASLDDGRQGWWAWLRGRRALAFGSAFALLLIASGAVLLWQALSRRNQQGPAAVTQEQRNTSSQNGNVQATGNGNQGNDAPANQGRSEPSPPLITSGTPTNEATPPAGNRRENRPAASSLLAVALEPGRLRGEGDSKKFPVPEGTKTVLLRLRFDEDEEEATRRGATYEAELRSGESGTIHQAENLRPSAARGGGQFVTLRVPARLLTAGSYQVVLRKRSADGQAEGVGSYYFSVVEARHHRGEN